MIPGVTIVCGIPDGGGRPHGKALAVVGVEVGNRIVNLGGAMGELIHSEGARWQVVACDKHGILAVLNSTVLDAFRSHQRKPRTRGTVVAASKRIPPLAMRLSRKEPEVIRSGRTPRLTGGTPLD